MYANANVECETFKTQVEMYVLCMYIATLPSKHMVLQVLLCYAMQTLYVKMRVLCMYSGRLPCKHKVFTSLAIANANVECEPLCSFDVCEC